jgi:predicted HTH transcriptional regulator
MNMKTLNYVNMFSHGIREVKSQLAENGNPAPEFKVDYITAFAVEIPVAKDDEPAVNSGVGEKSDQVTAQVSDQGAKNIVENITESIVENIVVKLSTMRAEIVRIIWRPPKRQPKR